jgi:hypothetical protein
MRNDDWFDDDSCSSCGDFNFKESPIDGLCVACLEENKKEIERDVR